jgi:hypothetical protein
MGGSEGWWHACYLPPDVVAPRGQEEQTAGGDDIPQQWEHDSVPRVVYAVLSQFLDTNSLVCSSGDGFGTGTKEKTYE